MKKIFLFVVLIVSMATTMNAQPQFIAKVSPQDLSNSERLIKHYNNLPMTTMFSSLPENRMIQLMKAVDKQCESAYILNKILAAEPSSKILKQAIMEGMIQVPGGRLMDFNKVLKRYNELK